MRKRDNSLWNLLRAMRLERTLSVLMIILIPVAYTNKFPLSIFVLCLAAILIYGASAIYNAHRDGDYSLPEYSPAFIVGIFLVALIISLSNKIIFFTALSTIFLGYLYNTLSRFFIIGDAFVAGFTHFAIPIIASSLLVGLKPSVFLPMASLTYMILFCIVPITNLKDIQKDKKLGYKTLVNTVENPKIISIIFFIFSLMFFFIFSLFLGIRDLRLIFLFPVLLIGGLIIYQINYNYMKRALKLLRLYLILSFSLLILILSSISHVSFAAFLILFTYLLVLLGNYKNGTL